MYFVKEVTTNKELKDFIGFPKSLYRGCPHFVPSLDRGEYKTLTKHPALDFCELKMWLVYNDENQIVGRVAGIINHKCNEMKGQKRVRFGWFDFIEDVAVAQLLLGTVEKWGAENGMLEICGPSRFSNMDKQAMLVEGFDQTPSIAADYNYPYYPVFMDQLHFEKEVDYIQYKVKVLEVPDIIERLASRVQMHSKVHIRQLRNKAELIRAGKDFFKVLNRSYQNIFNFIPLTEAEIEWLIKENFSFAVLDLISILEDENGKMVGISFCLPSLSEAFQKMNGKISFMGVSRVLKSLKYNKNVDMFLTGVLPEYQNSGIHLLYHKYLNESFLAHGFEYAYTSQQLEDNPAAHIWKKYDAELICRRRCYKKKIEICD